MATTNVKSVYNSSMELIHEWCNNLLLSTSHYEYDNVYCNKNNLYINSTLVATRIDKDIFIEEFNHKGSFGNGYCTYDIIRAISKLTSYYRVYELPTEDTFKNRQYFYNWFISEYIEENKSRFEDISLLKEFANNPNLTVSHIRPNDIQVDSIRFCPPKYINKYRGIYSQVVRSTHFGTRRYGWGRYSYTTGDTIQVNHRLRDLFKDNVVNLFLTKEEIEEVEFKIWHKEYTSGIYTKSKAREIYNNAELKKARESKIISIRKHRKELNDKKKAERKLANIKDFIYIISEWKNNDNIRFVFNHCLPYTSIKLSRGMIVTSLGMTLTMKEARLAYTIFKNYKTGKLSDDELKDIRINNYSIVKIGDHYIPTIVNNEAVAKKEYCFVIGCHVIPEFEINDLIKTNNLDW